MKGDVEGRAPAACSILQALYPAPLSVQAAEGSPERLRFVALPHARAPRLLFDARASQTASQSLRQQASSPRLRRRLATTALAAAVRSGIYGHLPQARMSVYGPDRAASVEDPLRELLGVPSLRLAIPIGPRRANRKAVLQVSDGQGTLLAFVKVGHNDLTRELVRHEAESLVGLTARTWSVVRIPRVLAVVDWRDLTLLVLEPLPMPEARLRGDESRARLLSVVAEIATGDGTRQIPWSPHPLRERLHRGLDIVGRSNTAWLAELSRLPGDCMLPTGTWHGDLNPGNLALSSATCPVWDWERYEPQIPIGFDLLHHDLQESITVHRTPPASAVVSLLRSAPSVLQRFGLDAVVADTVCRAYLLTLAVRYLADDQAAAGSRLGAVDDWLLPSLQEAS